MIVHSSFIRNVWISAKPSVCDTLPFTYPHVLTLLASNSLLSIRIASFSVTYPHTPDKARMNHHQASYLIRTRLIFLFYTSVPKIMIICYTVPSIWRVTDVLVTFHVELFFGLLAP